MVPVSLLLFEGSAGVVLAPLPLVLIDNPSLLVALPPATAKRPNSYVCLVQESRRHGWKFRILDVLEGSVPSCLKTLLGTGGAQWRGKVELRVGF